VGEICPAKAESGEPLQQISPTSQVCLNAFYLGINFVLCTFIHRKPPTHSEPP
jgi:hypothetical protein